LRCAKIELSGAGLEKTKKLAELAEKSLDEMNKKEACIATN